MYYFFYLKEYIIFSQVITRDKSSYEINKLKSLVK